MKTVNRTTVVCVVLAAFAVAAAAEIHAKDGPDKVILMKPARKVGFLGRLVNGVKNVVIAPLDIPFTIVRHTSASGNPIGGVITGALEGVVNGTVRIVAGAVEVVTAPVPGARYPLYRRDLGERCIRQKPAF